jgi:transitional endoplasmic reticulum ATPase
MKPFISKVGIWVFGYLPSGVAIYAALGMLFYWSRMSSGTLRFQVFGKPGAEAIFAMVLAGYFAFLHIARLIAAMRSADHGRIIPNMPVVTTASLAAFTRAVMIFGGLFFALWGALAEKHPATNYYLPATLGGMAAFSWLTLTFGWVYGYKVAYRTQTQHGEAGVEEVARDVARVEKAKLTFKDILGNTDIKRRLLDAGRSIVEAPKGQSKARNGILLDGEPGNGKTVFAEALAGELKLPLLKLTHADVASRWVGARTENIKAAFDQAIRQQPCLLFIDEIDSFLPDRSTDSAQTKEDSDVTNSLLTLLVDIRKHRVVVIAATNHMDRLDGAAVREGRFDFKVEITPPDEEARIGLLNTGLKNNAPTLKVEQATIDSVAKRWNGFSVKRILAVTEELPSYVADAQQKGTFVGKLQFDDFMGALRRLQGRKGVSPENVKPMSEMVLPEVTREALEMLSSRLKDPQRLERLGGTLPSGVLFYGPPGTGKTAACKALAKEVQWAYLIATGTDLAREPKKLDKLYAQAKDIRPCIIFVDEADDLLMSRESSRNTEATNKLLTIMDGVNDRVRDVVWVAATNNPDLIDAALLRGGRFTEKVEFVRPDEDQLTAHIANWFQQRNIALATGLQAAEISSMLGDQSIANTEAVLQYSVNRAISQSADDRIVISTGDVKRGVTMVLGDAC